MDAGGVCVRVRRAACGPYTQRAAGRVRWRRYHARRRARLLRPGTIAPSLACSLR